MIGYVLVKSQVKGTGQTMDGAAQEIIHAGMCVESDHYEVLSAVPATPQAMFIAMEEMLYFDDGVNSFDKIAEQYYSSTSGPASLVESCPNCSAEGRGIACDYCGAFYKSSEM